MKAIQKILITLFITSLQTAIAFPSFHSETTPPLNAGAIRADELGPVFSHPFSPEETAPAAPPAPEKPKKKDILSLFQDDKPKTEEVNPLEEMAKNEMKALESTTALKSEKRPKEIDLDNLSPDSKALPTMLR